MRIGPASIVAAVHIALPDLERVRIEALRSAEPTHAHPDGAIDLASNAFMNFAVDRDTMRIVGGIVACATGVDGISILWREANEKLPL
jgi:hypothetical protein